MNFVDGGNATAKQNKVDVEIFLLSTFAFPRTFFLVASCLYSSLTSVAKRTRQPVQFLSRLRHGVWPAWKVGLMRCAVSQAPQLSRSHRTS